MNKKNLKPVIVSLALLGLLMPVFASANVFEDVAEAVLAKFFYFFAYIFSFIGSLFFALGAFLTKVGLSLNFELLAPNNQLLFTGWRIVRDIANLGFVLVIIIIAVATILRYETYGNKKILIKLIGAAILVNFSLTIAGVFIDFSHVVTNFFFQKISTNPFELASSIAGAFNPQSFVGIPQTATAPEGSNILETLFVGTASLVFVIVFTALGAFALIATAGMLFLRYLWLTFLLILAPIVWLFWVIPALESQWNKWWNKFFQWVFFAPAVSFFIYLALLSTQFLSATDPIYGDANKIFGGLTEQIGNIAAKGAQMTVLVGILLGGLIVAQKMSITGAKGAVGGAKGLIGGVGKWAAQKTDFRRPPGAKPGLITRAADAAAGGLQKFGNWRPQSRLARIASYPFRKPFQAAAGGLAGGLTAVTRPKEPPTTLLGFMMQGALTGSGLWKRGRKAKGTTASGEEVTMEIPEEEGGATPTPTGPAPESPLAGVDQEREEFGERRVNL